MSDVSKMLQFHALGIQRVSRIVDGNANYDELMEHRLGESHWAVFDTDTDVAEKCANAIALFEKKFRERKPKAIIPEFAGFACEGSTRNNLREFEFFERVCAPAGIKILRSNYSECESVSVSKLTNEQSEARESISGDVVAFYNGRSEVTASLVRQQILYSRSFFNFLLAFSRPGAVRPAALVQANDHSPVRVALSMVMKGLGIPRIYLQHAEVTQSFPELDFEYSVLRNIRSRETYEAIGPVNGEVFVIAREEEEFARERLFKEREDGVTVVIYPTSRVLVEQLLGIIRELKKNPAVRNTIVKQHPAAAKALDGSIEGSGATLARDIPDEDHVAIVGNSSIAIELLHRGVPVYQNFNFDPVNADYYGFVARGLTYQVALSELSSKFWRAYVPNDQWIAAYARWDPTAAEGYLDEQARFVDTMARIAKVPAKTSRATAARPAIKGRLKARTKAMVKRAIIGTINASPRLSGFVANRGLAATDRFARFLLVNTHNGARFFQLFTDLQVNAPVWRSNGIGGISAGLPGQGALELIEYTLANVEQPAEWLRLNERTQTFTPLETISALDRMFQNRNPALNAVFHDCLAWETRSAVGAWVRLKTVEWGNMDIDLSEIDDIAVFIYAYEDDVRVRSTLELMLLSSIVRCGTCEQLDRFWSAAKTRKEDLSINRKIDVLRKLRSTPGREAEAANLQRLFEDQATPFESLKLRNADFLEGRSVEGWGHQYAEREFERTAPSQLAQEFATHIRPTYDRLRSRMRLMEVRTDLQRSDEFLKLAQRAITDKTPFSLVRLSDGEGYLFPESRFFSQVDAANRERHWWGTELPEDLRERIVKEARQAVMKADVVGIPSIYRFIRDSGDTSISLLRSLQGRGLVEVLNGIPDAISPDALITEDKINVALFSDVDAITPLAELAGKIIVVTSAKADSLPPALTQGRRVEVVPIPTHHKTTLNAKYHNESEPLPFVYPTVLEKLDKLVEPGDLVLIAGGIVGKIFVGHVRARGAVALDIGHTLDDWIHEQLPSLR
ncbi:GT-D fold domain-containing protein [Pelagibacterium lentulum]|uniref:GT-D fold-like domain-containing protein n=1 Tax=Pelagibacterium lentulum TaxID=2029865 RepID=A0A916R743_9HYPH|nr:hypothetical protein [Pelagibacterium lentulum]GGA40989.1 hypothetical protein GCM10011499_08210 [Pelagibacterium lentulum]